MKQATEAQVARGWESKAVEQQQDEASRRGESSGPREASATDRRRSLELARAQLVARRDAARTDAQREASDCAIEALEAQIAALRAE
jgi:hypothetical protein